MLCFALHLSAVEGFVDDYPFCVCKCCVSVREHARLSVYLRTENDVLFREGGVQYFVTNFTQRHSFDTVLGFSFNIVLDHFSFNILFDLCQ